MKDKFLFKVIIPARVFYINIYGDNSLFKPLAPGTKQGVRCLKLC